MRFLKKIVKRSVALARQSRRRFVSKNKFLLLILVNGLIDYFFIRNEVYLSLSKLRESNEMKVLKKLLAVKGNLFIDIGACYGGYALRLSKNFARIVAFEPEDHNFRVLTLLIKLLRKEKIQAIKAAISNQDGITRLFVDDGIYSHTIKPAYATELDKFKLVKAISLDGFVTESVDLIKVDVQGAALDALLGATSVTEKIKRWMIELESYELGRKRELENLLKSLDYRVEWVSNQHIYAEKKDDRPITLEVL